MIYEYNEEGYVTDDFQQFLLKRLKDDKHRHDCYFKSVEHAEEMAVHLYGDLPVKLLNTVRPREEAETKAYRLAIYQPTTKATAEKAVSIVSKIFNPSLYSIQWKSNNTSSEKLMKYSMENYPEYNSVTAFIQQTVIKKMLADPNAVLAVTLANYEITDADRPEPIAVVYGSANVWYQDRNTFLIFKRKEDYQSLQGHSKHPKYFFCLYDTEKILEFSAQQITGDKVEIIEIAKYVHNFGEVPVWHLRGVPEAMDNGVIYYKSFFEAAVPFWNKAITHESDLDGAYINHLHPIRAELAEECDYIQQGQRCKQGNLTFPDGKTGTCPSCHGSGYRSVKSPYGVYQYNKDKLSGEGASSLTPVQYITVPTEPTAMLEARVAALRESGLNALNMDILNKIGENQSGVAKVIDRDELYDFLYRISTVCFDIHLANIFYYFNKFMFGISDKSKSNENLPEINKPVQFDISSALELMEEMKAAKDAGVDTQFLRQSQKMVNDKKFASSPDIKAKLDLMLDLDPAPQMDLESITLAVDKGLLPKQYAVIHVNIEYFVDRAMIENKGFATLTKEKKMELLTKYAEELMEEMKPVLDQSAIDDGNGTGGQAGQDNEPGSE
jgi:hypothetical protein